MLTATYPFLPYKALIIALIGLFSSFASVNMGIFLKNEVSLFNSKSAWVLGGVALDNAATFTLSIIPTMPEVKYLILGIVLASILIFQPNRYEFIENKSFNHTDALFIFALYLAGGIMYGIVMPKYMQTLNLQTVEVIFYVIAVLCAVFLISKQNSAIWILKVITIVLIGFSFVFMHLKNSWTTSASMFLLQSGFGFADIYVLLLLLKYPNPMRSFGMGFAIVCASILAGTGLSYTNLSYPLISAIGTLALILTAVSLMMTQYRLSPAPNKKSEKDMEAFINDCLQKLSKREQEVLALMLKKKSYRAIAKELGISISSVREYVKRICTKLGMDKDEIVDIFKNAKL